MILPLLVIDVAHPPRSAEAVEALLLDAWAEVRNSSTLRILKVVHGHGSSGKGGSTKEFVRNWAYRNRARFRAVIDGENYGLFDDTTRHLRKDAGSYEDSDLDVANPGITLIWIR